MLCFYKDLGDIGIENLSEILNSSLTLATYTTFTTLQSMINAPMSFVSNDLSSDILSVEPSYHVLQPWLANDFQQPLMIYSQISTNSSRIINGFRRLYALRYMHTKPEASPNTEIIV